MLRQILLSGKANARAALTVAEGAHAARFWAAVLAVDFTLVPEEAARVGEALDFFAAGFFADVGAGVFVHMLAIGMGLGVFV